jgi:putative oxidoreductase
MAGAIVTVHLPHGFSVANGGYEFAMTEFLVALALLFTGPGTYSLNPALPAGIRKF